MTAVSCQPDSRQRRAGTAAQVPCQTVSVRIAQISCRTLLQLFLDCLASKLLTYALGRELGIADQPTMKAAVEHTKKSRYTLRSLVQFLATSESFQTK